MENKIFYLGGKPDDITVIVAQITTKEKVFYDTSCNTSTTDNDFVDEELKKAFIRQNSN
jgi:hypothetical protein